MSFIYCWQKRKCWSLPALRKASCRHSVKIMLVLYYLISRDVKMWSVSCIYRASLMKGCDLSICSCVADVSTPPPLTQLLMYKHSKWESNTVKHDVGDEPGIVEHYCGRKICIVKGFLSCGKNLSCSGFLLLILGETMRSLREIFDNQVANNICTMWHRSGYTSSGPILACMAPVTGKMLAFITREWELLGGVRSFWWRRA